MPIICCNWKMNGNRELLEQYSNLQLGQGVKAVLLPPSPLINIARNLLSDCWLIGGQSCHAKASGAYTGMVSCSVLSEVGARCVLVGHSERRDFEDAEFLRSAYYAAENLAMQPILCIGEKWDEREEVFAVLTKQLSILNHANSPEIWVAYEPRWAIGTGKTPVISEVEEIFSWIRQKIQDIKPRQLSKIRLLYGGSLGLDNCQQFFASKNIDGGLIGGASLRIDQIREILL